MKHFDSRPLLILCGCFLVAHLLVVAQALHVSGLPAALVTFALGLASIASCLLLFEMAVLSSSVTLATRVAAGIAGAAGLASIAVPGIASQGFVALWLLLVAFGVAMFAVVGRQVPLRVTGALFAISSWVASVVIAFALPDWFDRYGWLFSRSIVEVTALCAAAFLTFGFATPVGTLSRSALRWAVLLSVGWTAARLIWPTQTGLLAMGVAGVRTSPGILMECLVLFGLALSLSGAWKGGRDRGAALLLALLGTGTGSFVVATLGILRLAASYPRRERPLFEDWFGEVSSTGEIPVLKS